MSATSSQAGHASTGAGPRAADTAFRALGVVLQIAATLAIARTLSLFDTGLFFEGFVVTLAGAAFMRAKFDVYLGRHIVAGLAHSTGIGDAEVLRELSARFMKRCCLICAVLLVIAADLDVMAQYLRPYLQTFVPFVLALPFAGYATMIGAALRAANRYLMGLMCTAYVMNGAILLAVAVAPPHPPLELFSWIFLAGSLLAAGVAHGFARRVFGVAPVDATRDAARRAAWAQIDHQIESEAGIGFANVALLWAPLGLLVALAPPDEMALFAVSTRSAQLILYLMPVLALLVAPRLGRLGSHLGGAYGRGALWLALSGVALASAAMATLLIVAAPWSLAQYGAPYAAALGVYLALIVAEALSVTARPLYRYHAAHWDAGGARHVLYAAAAVATLVSLALTPWQGAFGAALGLAAGHATAVALGLWSALRHPPLLVRPAHPG